MYRIFLNSYGLLDRKAKLYFPLSAFCSLFVSIAEALGVGMIMPFVLVITDPTAISNYSTLSTLATMLGTQTHASFIVALGLFIVIMFVIKNLLVLALLRWQVFFLSYSEAELAIRLLQRYYQMPLLDIVGRNTSELIRNTNNEVTVTFNGFLLPILSLITELVVVFSVSIVVFAADKYMAIGITLFFVFTAGAYYTFIKSRFVTIGKEILKGNFLILRDLKECISAIKEITVLGQVENLQDRFSNHRRELAKYRSLNTFLSAVPRLYLEISMMIGIAVVAALTLQDRPMAEVVGVLSLLAAAGLRVMPSVNRILMMMQSIRVAIPSVKAVLSEFEFDLGESAPVGGTFGSMPGGGGDIKLSDVVFRYPSRESAALNGVTLTVQAGQSVGFVGASGAGKSTLVDVLLGFIIPTQGHVTYNGVNIHENLKAWRKKIGYVSQTIFLSDDTIKANIALGVPSAEVDDARLDEVIRLAHFDDVVRKLPEGLKTVIGEEGVQLSVGQRQRIGIARALYHNPEVLIFDEATSALDNETEHRISQMINELGGTKTIIIVAHRLSTVRDCDKVFYFEGGQKVDEGDFLTLESTCPGFANLAAKGRI